MLLPERVKLVSANDLVVYRSRISKFTPFPAAPSTVLDGLELKWTLLDQCFPTYEFVSFHMLSNITRNPQVAVRKTLSLPTSYYWRRQM